MISLKKIIRSVAASQFLCGVFFNTPPHLLIGALRLSFFERNLNQKEAVSG